MATPLSGPKVFDYHAALDCVPGNHSEIEKRKTLAFEISLVNSFHPIAREHKNYIEIHYHKYQAFLNHARRCILMFQGMGLFDAKSFMWAKRKDAKVGTKQSGS
ncbi:MAG: hypothetical protein HRU43_05825 [Simkaniaceae bacterium]|nr:hypothetical protein [Simkaniaceae bacterium]